MKGEISAFVEKSCHIYFISMGVVVVGSCHEAALLLHFFPK